MTNYRFSLLISVWITWLIICEFWKNILALPYLSVIIKHKLQVNL